MEPPPSKMTQRELLRDQLEPLEAASSNVAMLSLIPAIQVAWADGVVQDKERQLILALAASEGLAGDEPAMERIARWLDAPPADAEVEDMLGELRGSASGDGAGSDEELVGKMVAWARAVARADGGLLGIGAVGSEEARMLEWLESALDPERAWGEAGGVPSRRTRPATGPGASGLAVMRDLLAERAAGTGDHVDLVPKDVESMWPRGCPLYAERMPPAVFGIPEDEYRAFSSKIVTRYVRSLTLGTRHALRAAVTDAVSDIDDRELGALVRETPFSRFLVPKFDPVDEQRFAASLPKARRLGTPYKLDLSHIGNLEPLPDVALSPTVALFAETGTALEPVAIGVGEHVFEPDAGESWARARIFLLSGCSLSLVAGIHSSLHFPMDSVIAVTREVLPGRHPLARLVEAHSYLHLPLDYGVRWNVRSVAWNNQREIYTPFPTSGRDVFRGFADYYAGIEGNSGYPGYRYPMAPPDFPGPYCEFLRAYYDVVLAFCRTVAAKVQRDAPELTRWGAALHELLPGFPSPDELRDEEVLARTMAGFVHTVSIWHSTEHHVYGSLPVRKVPQRLRVPPPKGGDAPIPTDRWVRPTDVFRQEMARQMFYEAHTVRSILEVEYGFAEPELRAAADDFFAALRACDRAQPRRFIELQRIACSIQF